MTYGFGIVGLGLIAEFHARAIKAMEKGKLVACYSRSQAKADAFSKKYNCTGYSTMKEFCSHPGLNVVTICTPSGMHLEPSLEIAKAGKHLIVEKPLEISLERCDKIIETCEKNKVKLAGIFPSRFHDITKVIKSAIDEGRFGKLVLGDAYVKWYRSQEYYNKGGWHGTWELDGGGALMNQSIHAIDLLQYFMGPVEEVQSFTEIIGHKRIKVEDNAVAVIRFKNGALGVVEGSTSVYPGFLKRIEISGTKGSAIMEEENLKAWSFVDEKSEDKIIRKRFAEKTGTGGGAADPAAIGFHGHQRQFEDMVKVLETDSKPLVDGYEARKAVEIILAIYKSAKEGKKVKLPL
jgi:UDP-N-acetyl-2-amino-2-deoxyglucuronate dehydrogenase